MRTIQMSVYLFSELSEKAQNKALNEQIQFHLEVDQEAAFVRKAIKESERMQTPWFVGEYVLEYGKEIVMEELNRAEYFENGEFYQWLPQNEIKNDELAI